MMTICRTERFERCLDELRQGGGDALVAVARTERLIREFSHGTSSTLEERWKTRNGEARIDGCRKFQIGHRYRLVCVKHGQQILFVYVGTHDDCDRWIDKNRGATFEGQLMPAVAVSMPEPPAADGATDGTSTLERGIGEEYGEELSQRDLRVVFRGLCGGS